MMDQIEYQQCIIGAQQRKLFILDQVTDTNAADLIHDLYRELPVSLSDSDREDTQHIKHLMHEFGQESWQPDSVCGLLANHASEFLARQNIPHGGLYRIYANFNLHGDFQYAHEDGEGWTALYFVNSKWHEDWGGEFMVYPDDDSAYHYAIQPKPGRMVIFDGMIRHRGGVPSKLCFDARISLAIKFGAAHH